MSIPPHTSDDTPAESQEFVLQEPLGSVLVRLAARLFDAALMLLAVLAGIPLPDSGRIAILVAVPILYETIMVAMCGRTVGKMVMGLHVVRRRDGGRPELLPSLARGAPAGILAAGPVFAAIVMLLCILPMVGDTRLQRSLQDRIARTVVVQRQRPWAARSTTEPARGAS
ncbi:MAG: RDD family protein [Acidimicrobiia bacterium]|nr:RDD family protein [Acidimicrobiia bacterium]